MGSSSRQYGPHFEGPCRWSIDSLPLLLATPPILVNGEDTMACKQCQGIERFFDQKEADKDLAAYRKKGPAATTQMLVDAITAQGVDGGSLLDIGGGVGAIQNELLGAGIKSAVSVDASTAYARVAEQEAERQGHADRISRHHGDFVDAAPNLDDADVVTLDRVICCYHDVQNLVGLSSQKAKRVYALVFPRENLLSKLGFGVKTCSLGCDGAPSASSSTQPRSSNPSSRPTACAASPTTRPDSGRLWSIPASNKTAAQRRYGAARAKLS